MNNVSPINKAQRLTEAEVHTAADELEKAGSKVSSIELYKHLGRGSLTTISNFMKSWRSSDEKKSTLPTLVGLPDTLKVFSEQLIIKVWAASQKLAESELYNQREALRQAEAMANEKIEEAQAFSEEQAKKIDYLENQIEILKKEMKKSKELFLIEEKNLRNDLESSRLNASIFEQRLIETEKQFNRSLDENKELKENIKNMETEKQREVDVSRKEERRLQTEISHLQIKENDLKGKVITAEEMMKKSEKERLEEREKQLNEIKKLGKERDEALKNAARIEGELKAWKILQQKENEVKEKTRKPKHLFTSRLMQKK